MLWSAVPIFIALVMVIVLMRRSGIWDGWLFGWPTPFAAGLDWQERTIIIIAWACVAIVFCGLGALLI